MDKPLKPLVRGGGSLPSKKRIPLVYPGGYTTLNERTKHTDEEINEQEQTDGNERSAGIKGKSNQIK